MVLVNLKGVEMSRKTQSSVLEAPVKSGKTVNVTSNSKQEDKKMSKTETTVKTETKAPEAEEIKKSVKFYDLVSFEMKEAEIKASFTPPATFQEAMTALSTMLSGNQESLRDALIPILRNAAIANQKRTAIGENGAPKRIVLDQIKTFRDVPPFNAMVTAERGKPGWKEQYQKQTDAIVAEVKGVPFIVNAIKAKAAADTGTEDGDEE